MKVSPKFFRRLAKLNQVLATLFFLGLLGLVAVGFLDSLTSYRPGSGSSSGPQVIVGTNVVASLELADVVLIEGTEVFRAKLVEDAERKLLYSSGYNSRDLRNLLFIRRDSGSAKWLLPDAHHSILQLLDVSNGEKATPSFKIFASVALVADWTPEAPRKTGELLLFDPGAELVVPVASDVRHVHQTWIDGAGISILYESAGQMIISVFSVEGLKRTATRTIQLPALR
jgi:hypothetical protein